MNLFYRIAYGLGLRPWEQAGIAHADLLAALFAREEEELSKPFGAALDLGCGTGIHSVTLAKRGWHVTGIDFVARAISMARARARQSGIDVRFIEGDVTALRKGGVGSGFRFGLDFGCFHGLDDAQRLAMASEVSAVTTPDATLLLIAFAPGKRAPFPRGASRGDIAAAFVGWEIIATDPLPVTTLPFFLKSAAPQVYRLRKAGNAP